MVNGRRSARAAAIPPHLLLGIAQGTLPEPNVAWSDVEVTDVLTEILGGRVTDVAIRRSAQGYQPWSTAMPAPTLRTAMAR